MMHDAMMRCRRHDTSLKRPDRVAAGGKCKFLCLARATSRQRRMDSDIERELSSGQESLLMDLGSRGRPRLLK